MNAFLIFALVGAAIIIAIFMVSRLLREDSKGDDSQVECGMPAEGNARAIGFKFFNYASLFLVLELAALFFFLASIKEATFSTFFILVFISLVLGIAILFAARTETDAV